MTNRSTTFIILAFRVIGLVHHVRGDGSSGRLECYACGLPRVDPEQDALGSYGRKLYNHSCPSELISSHLSRLEHSLDDIGRELALSDAYVRLCPPGVQSCFAAHGSYGAIGNDDLVVRFLGCSETTRSVTHGCNTRPQIVDVPDRNSGRIVQVEIEVRLCFCSSPLCNHAHLGDKGGSDAVGIGISIASIMIAFLV